MARVVIRSDNVLHCVDIAASGEWIVAIKPVYIRQFLALIDSAVDVKQDGDKNKSKP
jgi:hypothetical protein